MYARNKCAFNAIGAASLFLTAFLFYAIKPKGIKMKNIKKISLTAFAAMSAGALLAGVNWSGKNISRENYQWYSYDFSQATLNDATAVYTTFKSNTDWSGSTFLRANLQGANFGYKSSVAGADFTSADLRGASNFAQDGAILKNTVLTDGSIANFEMDSDGDAFVVYDTTSVNINIYMDSRNYSVSNGASFIFRLSESSSQDDAWGFGEIFGKTGASITFGENSNIVLDFGEEEAVLEDYALFSDIELEGCENVKISALSNGVSSGINYALSSDGKIYAVSQVPEPSSFAAILGLSAIAICALRSKKQ